MSQYHYYETVKLGGERVSIFVASLNSSRVTVAAVFPKDGARFQASTDWPLGKPRTEFALAEIICDVEDMAVQCERAVRSKAVSAFAVVRVAIKETLRLLNEPE